MDRLDCLKAFVQTMECGSFSGAARELGLGQPAISKRIALLETEFGSQLFMRNTRKLTPTREAHRIYDLARQALGCFELARASIGEAPASRPARCVWAFRPRSAGTTSCRSSSDICANVRRSGSISASASAPPIWSKTASNWRCASARWNRAR